MIECPHCGNGIALHASKATQAEDPVKIIFDAAAELGIERSILGKLRKVCGDDIALSVVKAARAKSEPTAYIMAAIEQNKPKPKIQMVRATYEERRAYAGKYGGMIPIRVPQDWLTEHQANNGESDEARSYSRKTVPRKRSKSKEGKRSPSESQIPGLTSGEGSDA